MSVTPPVNSARAQLSPKVKWGAAGSVAVAILLPAVVAFLQAIPQSALASLGDFSGPTYAFIGATAAGLAAFGLGYQVNDELRNKGADVADAMNFSSIPPAVEPTPEELEEVPNTPTGSPVNAEALSLAVQHRLNKYR